MIQHEPSLGKAINSGVGWNLVASMLGQVINVIVTLGLSRLLQPRDYGLLAIALSVSGVLETLGGLGTTAAITQRPALTNQLLTGVVILLSCSTVIASGTILLLASPLASFYNQPELAHILYALALLVPLNLLQSIPLAILQRKLLFSRLSSVAFLGTVLSGGVALCLAYQGFSWQALVAKTLIFHLTLTSFYCLLGWPSFTWHPSWSEIKNLLRYGAPESLTQFVLMLGRRIDDILIGKWIGSSALGIYSMAYSLYLWPIANIKARIAQVVFPALSRVQHDPKQVHFYYLKLVSLSTNLGFPVIFGFMTISDLLVVSVMGDKWSEVVPLLRLLGIASLFEICISPGIVYQALARTDLYLKNVLLTRGFTIAGIVISLPFGLLAVGTSLIGTSLLNFFLYNYFVGQLIPLTNKEVLRMLLRSFTLSGSMLLTVIGIRYTLPATTSPFVELAACIATGLLAYLVLIYIFHRPLYTRVATGLGRTLQGKFIYKFNGQKSAR